MTKIIGVLVIVALVLLVAARLRIRLLPKARRPQANAQLQKRVDLILWIPPILVVLGAVYLVGTLILRAHN